MEKTIGGFIVFSLVWFGLVLVVNNPVSCTVSVKLDVPLSLLQFVGGVRA